MTAKQPPKAKTGRRIFLVDDHPVFREGLAGLIQREGDMLVCGEADSARQALAGIEQTKPDLVVVDISLPGQSGLELIKNVRAINPDCAMLVVSMHDETLYAERVLRAGARGYVMKQAGPAKIIQGIRQVLNGEICLSSNMSVRVLDAFSGRTPASSSPLAGLTDRELEVLQLLGQGKDSHEIASQLHLSFKTVDAHRAHIKEKLGLKNGTELICFAARWTESQASVSAADGHVIQSS